MKQAMAAFLFCALLALGNQLRATTLPDACGDDKVQFDVKTEKHPPAPAPPAVGMAQIVFVGLVDAGPGGCIGCGIFSPRVGIDGSWVGATKGNSYFSVDVDPGEHHLCAAWKSLLATKRKNVGVTSFTAEAGKVYYFQVRIREVEGGVMGTSGGPVSSTYDWVLDLAPLSEDEGRYLVKTSAVAAATARK
jgi:hypothetical protein